LSGRGRRPRGSRSRAVPDRSRWGGGSLPTETLQTCPGGPAGRAGHRAPTPPTFCTPFPPFSSHTVPPSAPLTMKQWHTYPSTPAHPAPPTSGCVGRKLDTEEPTALEPKGRGGGEGRCYFFSPGMNTFERKTGSRCQGFLPLVVGVVFGTSFHQFQSPSFISDSASSSPFEHQMPHSGRP